MPRIRVSTGIHLYYEVYGDGPPVLMTDGVGASWVWFKNVPALSQRFRVITLDCRGTGRSDKPFGPYTVEEMTRETGDVIRAVAQAPAHLIGLSLGGSVGLEMALSYPGLVRKLVLIGTTPGGRLQVPTPPAVASLLFPLPGLSPLANFQRTMVAALSPQYRATHPAELAEIARRALAAPTPLHGRLGIGAAGASWRGIAGRSQFIGNPALILNGEQDQLAPVVNAYRLASLLPRSRLYLFPGSGHLCQIEQTETFNRLVMDFLLGDERAASS